MWPLAFLQFGSAGMLIWGLAAALPLVIHLWSRRRYRQERWAAMEFLLAAVRKNARRIQLEQWVLLALRIAILLLFALALADPRSSLLSSWTKGMGTEPAHVVLVLDDSYSMGYRSGDKSRFETAKELARQLVTGGPPGSGYSLILMAKSPRAIILQPAFDRDDIVQEIDDLELGHSGANLMATLAEIETILRQSADSSAATGRFTRCQVYFFSDLQKATWGDAVSPDGRTRLRRLESLATLEVVDLGENGEGNLAVTRLGVDQSLITVGTAVQLQADIQCFASEDARRRSVEFFVDGVQIAEKQIDVVAAGQMRISAAHRFEVPGEHIVEVHLADDALPLDNRRWLSVPARQRVRVLCIGGRPDDTRLVAMALAPERSATTPLEVVEAPESRLLNDDLAEFDCVIISNVGRVDRAEAAALHRFLVRGGGLIVFLGDQTQPENYNHLLVDDPALGFLPARLDQLAPTAAYTLDPLEYRHPIVAPFRGFPKAGLLTAPVWKYVRLTPLEGTKTALNFSSGDPAIVERQVGSGHCFLVATASSPNSLDRIRDPAQPWTALPTWPSFPPLLHEMLHFSLAANSARRNVLVGDELAGFVSITSQSTVVLTGPGGLNERLPVRSGADGSQWSYNQTATSGIYEAHVGTSVERYAVNVDTAESDLTRLDPALLPSQLTRESGGIPDNIATLSQNASSYFRWLLAAIFLLLVLEPCLAWQFGRGRV